MSTATATPQSLADDLLGAREMLAEAQARRDDERINAAERECSALLAQGLAQFGTAWLSRVVR
jgi:hypothetical protein